MGKLHDSTMALASASKGNPAISTATVILFYFLFNTVEAGIESLIFGKRFPHLLDAVFGIGFIAYAAYSVWACAIWNTEQAAKGGKQ